MTVAERVKNDAENFALQIRRRQNYHYRFVLSKFRSAYESQVEGTLQALDAGTPPVFLSPNTVRPVDFQQVYQNVYATVGVDFAKLANRSMKSYAGEMLTKDEADDLEQTFLQRVLRYVQIEAAGRVVNVTNTTKQQLRQFLQVAISEGWGAERAARELRKEISTIGLTRARVIARTEILTASNVGQHIGYRSLNMELERSWLTARDERVRTSPFSHRAANGQKRGLEERFDVGGQKLLYPGDAAGSAANTIQCRCVTTATPK